MIGKCLLQNLLDKSKMTKTQLSDKTDIKLNQISRYLTNESHMSLSTARKISKVLNCKIDDLYEWKI
ncbi:helix-turn-helix transcriptional regulator [Niallia alba]|uniref:helix-turn-helix domain-containing protein n=1 Tax=Niallia alba TaxID=2729105 RepID=UPI0039A30ADF